MGVMFGYMLRLEPGIWMLGIGIVNVPFYSMEIKHCLCRNFNMIIGEMGPVELELVVSLIFLGSGGIWGCDVFDKTLS